jgi:Late competence development protein ComFB
MKPLLYRNVLEPLVAEEVQRQLENLSPELVSYINPEQAIAYALNRLPALYATSEEGWNRQQQKAKTELAQQIALATKSALKAVFQNPLKPATPLSVNHAIAEQFDEPIIIDFTQNLRAQLWP